MAHTIQALKSLCNNLKFQFTAKFNPHVKWAFLCYDNRQMEPSVVHTTNIDERELKNMLRQCSEKMGDSSIVTLS